MSKLDILALYTKLSGFKVQVNRLINFGFDLVQSTNPGAGKKAPEGSTITVNLV